MNTLKMLIVALVLASLAPASASSQGKAFIGGSTFISGGIHAVNDKDLTSCFGRGLSLDIKLIGFLGIETGVFSNTYLTMDKQKSYSFASFPLILELNFPRFANFSAGASIDLMYSAALGENRMELAQLGVIARLSRDIKIGEKFIFEPSFGIDGSGLNYGLFLSLGLKLKYQIY